MNINDEIKKNSRKSEKLGDENINNNFIRSMSENFNQNTGNNFDLSKSLDNLNFILNDYYDSRNNKMNMNKNNFNNMSNQNMNNINLNQMMNNNANDNYYKNQNLNNRNMYYNFKNMNNNAMMKNFNMNLSNNNINFNMPLNYNTNIIENKSFSFSRYKKATSTGFKDLGNTSYLNSVFQLLGCIRGLADYFLNEYNIINISGLSHLIRRLFIHLYPYPQKKEIYEPIHHLNYFNTKNIKNNPNDLLRFILNNLHRELNKISNNNNQIFNPNINDRKNAIENGIDNFKKSNNSIISNLFTFLEIKESQCCSCNQKSYNLLNYFILEIDIFNCYNYFRNNNNSINIYNCLQYEREKGQEKYCCINCSNYNMNKISKIICDSSEFLIISLDRGNLDKNLLRIPFDIEDRIYLDNYAENKKQYELIGIVSVYIQKSKYISCCRSPVDLNWYYYEDEQIENVVYSILIQYHKNNQFVPCILLYKRIYFK